MEVTLVAPEPGGKTRTAAGKTGQKRGQEINGDKGTNESPKYPGIRTPMPYLGLRSRTAILAPKLPSPPPLRSAV